MHRIQSMVRGGLKPALTQRTELVKPQEFIYLFFIKKDPLKAQSFQGHITNKT